MSEELERRRRFSKNKFVELKDKLISSADLIADKACVYATGSYGRVEASEHSDLDLFIVGLNNGKVGRDKFEGSILRNLNAIRVKADLIEVTRDCGIREFDGDGRYLSHFSVDKLAKSLGTPEDDAENTFTARLLLLLESAPLLEVDVYQNIIEDILAVYWRDYKKHKNDFVPAFLTNDIQRLWRTFCINYEAKTLREPVEEKAKGKLKNYKLKHGRILTCYSALLYLLAIYRRNSTVSNDDAIHMVSLTPTMRLQWLLEQDDLANAHTSITALLSQYDTFLVRTNFPEAEMVEKFKSQTESDSYFADA